MILFVGDKPSKFNTSPDVAFVGSKCYPRLLSWIDYLLEDGTEYMLLNRTDRDFKLWIYLANFTGKPIIALGQAASKAIPYPHIKLDHPSGLNRKLNNKSYIKAQLDAAKEQLSTISP